MDGGGKRRRIGKVRVLKILQPCPHIDTHNSNVHHLVHSPGAKHLQAQKLMALLIRNQLCGKKGSIGIIMGLVIRNGQHCLHLVPCSDSLFLGKPGTPAIQPRQLHHAGPQHTGIFFLAPCKNLGKGPAFHIGRRPHRRPLPFSGNTAGNLHTVSRPIYIGQAGLHSLIHQNRPPVHFYAAAFQESGIGADACCHDHQRAV